MNKEIKMTDEKKATMRDAAFEDSFTYANKQRFGLFS